MQRRRHGGSAARLSLVLALSGSLVLSCSPVAAFADPQSDLDAAREQLSQIGAEYQSLQQELLDVTAQVEETQTRILETTDELQSAQDLLASNISSDYKSGGAKLAQVILGATDFNDLISRVFYMDKVSTAQADAIEDVRTLKAQLEEQQTEQKQRLADAQAKVDEQAANQQAAQSLVNSLSEEVRQELQTAAESDESLASGIQSAKDAETGVSERPITGNTNNAGNAGNNDSGQDTSTNTSNGNNGNTNNNGTTGGNTNNNGGTTNTTPTPDPEPSTPSAPSTPSTPSGGSTNTGSSNNGGSANYSSPISYALAMEGQPYVWGGDSLADGGFDCSGLVCYAYSCIGVSLPHNSGSLRSYCQKYGYYTTDISQLQYGDLVFWSGHVAFYVGNGMVFGATTFGQPAGYGQISWYGTPLGGGRP